MYVPIYVCIHGFSSYIKIKINIKQKFITEIWMIYIVYIYTYMGLYIYDLHLIEI